MVWQKNSPEAPGKSKAANQLGASGDLFLPKLKMEMISWQGIPLLLYPKMYASARQFMGKNTVLFVSHDMASVQPKLTPKDEDFRDMRQDLFNTSVLRNNFKIFRRKKEGNVFGRVGPVLKMLCWQTRQAVALGCEGEKWCALRWFYGCDRSCSVLLSVLP